MDRDTTTRKGSHQKILGQVRRGEVNLLIGTQMITKGHDFPRVTLVGVLAADLSLNVPDFRAGERTFQLLTQVAGRAGRGDLPGKVFVQTFNPQHYCIQLAQGQDYDAFFRQEIQFRKEAGYPPFVRLVNLRLESNSESRLRKQAEALEKRIQKMLGGEKKFRDSVEILGPAMAPLAKLRGKHRCQMLFKARNRGPLHEFMARLLAAVEKEIPARGVKLIVDVDPVHML
jgi:primosomal protein N' (replication factor Y)